MTERSRPYPPGYESERLRHICEGRCGDFGDPPCWRLPDLSSDCKPEDVPPCAECLAELEDPS